MENNKAYSFQTDSEIVVGQLNLSDNYLVEYSHNVAKEYCVVYFSSNDIYYPNDELSFSQSIIVKNRYEWYANRVEIGHKHIFIRDIQKQWYLGGINNKINSPQKLLEFLKNQTEGYKTIFIGSSAGGFASVIYGQLLKAERILTFNGQFEIHSILNRSTESMDPLIFRYKNSPEFLPFYNARNFINNTATIYYFVSEKSLWDIEQNDYVKDLLPDSIKFNSSTHGLPFYKSNLQSVLNLNNIQLNSLRGKFFYQFSFSLKIAGWKITINEVWVSIKYNWSQIICKIYLLFFQRFKKKLFG